MRQAIVLVAVVAALAAVPLPGQTQSTTIGIRVPRTQVLEGTRVQTVSTQTAPQPGRLTIKSNIPWTLQVEVSGAAEVVWQISGTPSWQPLPAQGAVLTGPQGVHTVAYALRLAAGREPSAVVSFSLVPGR